MTEKVYDSHHELILKLRDQRLQLREEFEFYKKCKKCALTLKKRHSEENWLLSNHCLCHLVPCISMKLGTFVVITNKSARICLNLAGECVIQSLKSGKTRKSGLVPMSRQENLRIYSWYSLPDLKHDQKGFILILH